MTITQSATGALKRYEYDGIYCMKPADTTSFFDFEGVIDDIPIAMHTKATANGQSAEKYYLISRLSDGTRKICDVKSSIYTDDNIEKAITAAIASYSNSMPDRTTRRAS